MAFRTQYDRIRVFSNTGSPYLDSYKQSVDDDGEIILIKHGKENIYNKIQAERSSCELKQILARLAKDEWSQYDISKGGLFGDFTQVPKSVREMRERMIEAENMFGTLPVDIREKFGFSADRFFSSIGTPFYDSVMAPLVADPVPDPVINEKGEIKE